MVKKQNPLLIGALVLGAIFLLINMQGGTLMSVKQPAGLPDGIIFEGTAPEDISFQYLYVPDLGIETQIPYMPGMEPVTVDTSSAYRILEVKNSYYDGEGLITMSGSVDGKPLQMSVRFKGVTSAQREYEKFLKIYWKVKEDYPQVGGPDWVYDTHVSVIYDGMNRQYEDKTACIYGSQTSDLCIVGIAVKQKMNAVINIPR